MARLEYDRSILDCRYPGFVFSSSLKTRRLESVGTLRLVEETTGQPTNLQLRFVFPSNYPRHEPTVYEVGGRFPRVADRHINETDGSFSCHWLAPLSRRDPLDQNALLVLLERVSVFCEDQLTYEVVGRFPYGEWAHGEAGYAEYLFESLGRDSSIMDAMAARPDVGALPSRNASCLCGSGIKFKRCHMAALEAAIHHLGVRHFRDAVVAWGRGTVAGQEPRWPRSCSSAPMGPDDSPTRTADKLEAMHGGGMWSGSLRHHVALTLAIQTGYRSRTECGLNSETIATCECHDHSISR